MVVKPKGTMQTQQAVSLYKTINRAYERISKNEGILMDMVARLSPEEMRDYVTLTKGVTWDEQPKWRN
jgi:hypothetical protein